MAAPTSITLPTGYIIVQEYKASSIALNDVNGSFGIVAQIASGSAYAVDDLILFRKDDAIKFSQGSEYFAVLAEADIRFVFTDSLP